MLGRGRKKNYYNLFYFYIFWDIFSSTKKKYCHTFFFEKYNREGRMSNIKYKTYFMSFIDCPTYWTFTTFSEFAVALFLKIKKKNHCPTLRFEFVHLPTQKVYTRAFCLERLWKFGTFRIIIMKEILNVYQRSKSDFW